MYASSNEIQEKMAQKLNQNQETSEVYDSPCRPDRVQEAETISFLFLWQQVIFSKRMTFKELSQSQIYSQCMIYKTGQANHSRTSASVSTEREANPQYVLRSGEIRSSQKNHCPDSLANTFFHFQLHSGGGSVSLCDFVQLALKFTASLGNAAQSLHTDWVWKDHKIRGMCSVFEWNLQHKTKKSTINEIAVLLMSEWLMGGGSSPAPQSLDAEGKGNVVFSC